MIVRSRILACVLLLGAVQARAAGTGTLPPPADLPQRVTFEQHIGNKVPLELTFRDASGHAVRLGSLLQGRPTLLVPGYYRCANLCAFVRAGVASALRTSQLRPGRQFNVVLVSIDPGEQPADATATQRQDLRSHPGAGVDDWHYLTGDSEAISRLTHAIGFSYLFDPRNGQYDHGAGLVILTPAGTISQYLFGVQFSAETLRLALVDASRGRLGTVVDRLLLLCCDYDPSTGRYSLTIHRVMQGLGTLTALALGALILILRRAERRQ